MLYDRILDRCRDYRWLVWEARPTGQRVRQSLSGMPVQ